MIKYGIFGGFLMLVGNYLLYLLILDLESPTFISMGIILNAILIFIAPHLGLKAYANNINQQKYNYGKGFVLSFGISVLSSIVFGVVFIFVFYPYKNLPNQFTLAIGEMLLLLPFVFFLSIVLPLDFTTSKNKSQGNNEDVLDDDFLNH